MKALNGYDISKLWEMFAVGDSQISSRGKKKGQKRKVKVNKIQTEKNKDKTLRHDTESCILADCSLCPRNCHVDRTAGKTGYCGMDQKVKIARAALHMWEEPCISGTRGSGAVFFTGCNLRCCFCQNREIAIGDSGLEITEERLAEIFLELQEKDAANINLVTGTHYIPQIIAALDCAKKHGLNIPVVYNCGGYENTETLKLLDGYVDIYLPDYKYAESELAVKFSHANDYPERAMEAVNEMVRQTGMPQFDAEGYMKRGTIVRHLILPGHTRNSKKVLKLLHKTFGKQIYISIMNQYTPVFEQKEYTELNRCVTRREYEKVLDYAFELGIENGFFQDGETARESFIPAFDYEGVRLYKQDIFPINGRRPVLSYRRV